MCFGADIKKKEKFFFISRNGEVVNSLDSLAIAKVFFYGNCCVKENW